jgi:hypothetical protein
MNVFGMLFSSAILMMPIVFYIDGVPFLSLLLEVWGCVLAIAIFCTAFAYFLYFEILVRASVLTTKSPGEIKIKKFIIILFISIIPTKTTFAKEFKTEVVHDIYFGGFLILQSISKFSGNEKDYEISLKSSTKGVLKVFSNWTGQVRSSGSFKNFGVVPNRYWSKAQNADEVRITDLKYDQSGNIVSSKIDPLPDPVEVVALPKDAHVGTIDPVSVISQLIRTVSRGNGCAGQFSIFDGRRRYDLEVIDKGLVHLDATPHNTYEGPALACMVKYKFLGGQKKNRNWGKGYGKDNTIFIARPSAEGPFIPISLRLTTNYGVLTAQYVKSF